MILANNILLAMAISLVGQASAACTEIESITCPKVPSSPLLNGNPETWPDFEVVEAPLTGSHSLQPYPRGNGNVKIQCAHDDNRIYFRFEVPGRFRFSKEHDKQCAAISTMFKMGELATLVDMGGCPTAGDCTTAPEGCDPYKVDLGGHWELKTTEMGVTYGGNEGSGNDAVANKDDEYAVGSFCRFDDDDDKAANEWEGLWLHTSTTKVERAVEGADDQGSYIFEMSRSLQTPSTETDAQLESGKSIGFGFAFWDPYESEEDGWSAPGHYITGCSKDWISLSLVKENGDIADDELEESSGDEVKEMEGGEGATGLDEGSNAASDTDGIAIYGFLTILLLAGL